MEWVEYVIAILSGLAAAIPLVIKLVQYVQKAVKEKNWPEIVKLVLSYMQTAENKFTDNATRKEWVISMVKAGAVGINYDLDDAAIMKIGDMIDSICDAAKIINVYPEDVKEEIETEKAGA